MTDRDDTPNDGDGERPPGGWRGVVAAWQDSPEWRKLYAARAISLLGNWLNSLVLVELIAGDRVGASRGESAIALAIVFVIKQLPTTLLGPAAGVFADRYDRRRVMIVCEVLAALVVLGFLALQPGRDVWWVYVLTALQMSVAAFFLPAYQAVVPMLVKPKHLAAANVASSATWSIMFALGMAVGGIVMQFAGWKTAIVLDSLTYAVSAWLVVRIRWQSRPRPKREIRGLRDAVGITEAQEGLRYIRSERDVRRIILVKFGWGSMGAITLFLTLLGRSDYRFGEAASNGVSYLWGCRALGTLFGPLIAYRVAGDDPLRLEKTITWSFFLGPGLYALFAMTHSFWLGGAIVFLAHLAGSTLWVISTVLLQKLVPDEFRGRTFAAELGLVMLSSALSMLAYGALIDLGWLDVRMATLVASALCLVPALLWSRPSPHADPGIPPAKNDYDTKPPGAGTERQSDRKRDDRRGETNINHRTR